MRHDATPPELIEPIRAAFRNSARKLAAAGRIETIDGAIGAAYAAHDLARQAGMNPAEAIEWLRSAADVMERQLLEQAA